MLIPPFVIQEGKEALVLEGGGILGGSQAGLISEIDGTSFDLKKISVFAGTSIGAINACAYAAGVSSQELLGLWETTKEDEIAPKVRWSWNPSARRNKIDEYVRNRILAFKGLDPWISMSDLLKETGNEFYTVATEVGTNKAVIFGPNWFDIPVCMAVRYSVSHPLFFSTNQLVTPDGITRNLTDGGVVQNAPVSLFLTREDIDSVWCIGVATASENEQKNAEGWIPTLFNIAGGLVKRNELMAYSMGYMKWGPKFRLIEIQLSKDYDILDFSRISRVVHEGKKQGKKLKEILLSDKWESILSEKASKYGDPRFLWAIPMMTEISYS